MTGGGLRVLKEILSWGLPSPELSVDEDGDLVLDWPNATVAITEHGEINWAVDKRGHGTELQKLKEALMDAVKGE